MQEVEDALKVWKSHLEKLGTPKMSDSYGDTQVVRELDSTILIDAEMATS